jgi:hypothetical protein
MTPLAYRPGTLIGVAAIAAWILCILVALRDILFRRQDMTALSKVIWILVVIALPIVGLLVYFLASAFAGTSGR